MRFVLLLVVMLLLVATFATGARIDNTALSTSATSTEVNDGGHTRSVLTLARPTSVSQLGATTVLDCFYVPQGTPSTQTKFDLWLSAGCNPSHVVNPTPSVSLLTGTKAIASCAYPTRCGEHLGMIYVGGYFSPIVRVTVTMNGQTFTDSQALTPNDFDWVYAEIQVDTRGASQYRVDVQLMDGALNIVSGQWIDVQVVPRTGTYQLLDAVTRLTDQGWISGAVGWSSAEWKLCPQPSGLPLSGGANFPGLYGSPLTSPPTAFTLGSLCGLGDSMPVRIVT